MLKNKSKSFKSGFKLTTEVERWALGWRENQVEHEDFDSDDYDELDDSYLKEMTPYDRHIDDDDEEYQMELKEKKLNNIKEILRVIREKKDDLNQSFSGVRSSQKKQIEEKKYDDEKLDNLRKENEKLRAENQLLRTKL